MTYDQKIILEDIKKNIEVITANLFKLSINQTPQQKTVIEVAQVALGCLGKDLEDIEKAFSE